MQYCTNAACLDVLLITTKNFKHLKGGFHDSEHVHEYKFFFSPLHAIASMQASLFNCVVDEPIRSE